MGECKCPWCSKWFNSLGIMRHRISCREKLLKDAIAHLNGYSKLIEERTGVKAIGVDECIKRLEDAL
jgi:hypothetical protein